MKWKGRIVIFLITALLLITAAGCGSDKPLWMVLEDAQYNRYKPLLDHMVEKYGDMFEMDVYGTVTCTDPEYKDWRLACDTASDNFAIRLRRDDLELFINPNSLLCSRCLKSDFLVYKHPIPRIIQILLVYDVCADSAKKAAPKLEQLSL